MKKTISLLAIISFLITSMPTSIKAETLSEIDQEAITAYQTARANFLSAVAAYKSARTDFIAAKDKFRQLRDKGDVTELTEKAKDFAMTTDIAMIRYLEVLRKKIEKIKNISEEDRTKIITEIDEDINWLQGKQTEIENATTKEELINLAKVVRSRWTEIRAKAKRITGAILNAKIDYLINKAEELVQKISVRINELKAEGKDTSEVENLLNDINQKVAVAREHQAIAKGKYQAIKSLTDANQLFKEAMVHIKEANRYVVGAHKQLKEAVKKLKDLE